MTKLRDSDEHTLKLLRTSDKKSQADIKFVIERARKRLKEKT